MGGLELQKAKNDQAAQIFYMTEGLVNVTSGHVENPNWFECVEGGDLTITWNSGETDTVTIQEGMRYGGHGIKRIDVVSGKFHF